MELSQLRTFREVAEALSFTRAAQKLNMTQSAVSHQIKALERELGEPLFIRAKRVVHLSARLFESFMRDHEGIELSFRTTVSTEQTVADILNGAADVGFASLPVYSPALQVTELFEDELGLVGGAGHALAKAREVDIKELKRERFILFEQGASIRRATDAFFKRVELSPDMALESNDTYFIKLMVEHGIGVSVMP